MLLKVNKHVCSLHRLLHLHQHSLLKQLADDDDVAVATDAVNCELSL